MNSKKKSVMVMLRNAEDEYLLQFRDNNPGICDPLTWMFFGGGMESDDPIEEARREIREEIGVHLSGDHLSMKTISEYEKRLVHIISYSKFIQWDEISLCEGAGAGFFKPKDILLINASISTIRAVRDHVI